MHLYVQYGYVSLSIAICIFYIIVLLTIFKHRKTEFKSEFFKIFGILGVVDCYRMPNWIFIYVLPRWLEWIVGGGCPRRCIWFAGYATITNSTLDKVSKTLNLVLAINRFTCMACSFITHKKIWKHRVVPIVLLSILLAMVGNGGDYIVQIMSGAVYSKVVTANKTRYAHHYRGQMDPFFNRIWGLWNSIYAYGISASFVFLHGVALYKARKHRQEVQPIEADPNGVTEGIGEVEYKLLMAMSVLSLAQISNGIYIMSAGFFPEIFFADMDLYFQGWDLIVLGDCMSNPVLIFLMCSELREKVIQFVKCG